MPDDRMPPDRMAPGGAAEAPLHGLLQLLALHQEARRTLQPEALRFVVLNRTRALIAYRQAAVFAGLPRGGARLEGVSNVAVPDRDAPAARWLESVAAAVAAGPAAGRLHRLDPASLPARLREEWGEWSPPQVLWCPLPGPDGTPVATLWLARDDPWSDGETVLLERLAEGYGHAWWAHRRGRRRPRGVRPGLVAALAGAALAGALALPVPQTTVAPAEVTARDPVIVAAPLDGVVERFFVQPNQPVAEGQPLFAFEPTVLRARAEVARKALGAAEAEYLTAMQGAFADPQSKARLAQLKAQVDLRKAELALARDLLDRVTVRADRAGVAVFADVNDWIGKPVTVGERILSLADPRSVEIAIQVPVGDATVLEEGAAVRLFLNVDPLQPLSARLVHASYEPGLTAAGVLAYRAKAALDSGPPPPRIGLRGTARVGGAPVPLALYLFRRPLAALRQGLGI